MRILMAFHAPPYPPDIGPSRRNYHHVYDACSRVLAGGSVRFATQCNLDA